MYVYFNINGCTSYKLAPTPELQARANYYMLAPTLEFFSICLIEYKTARATSSR